MGEYVNNKLTVILPAVFAVAMLAALFGTSRSLQAAELVMFEMPACEWCARWDTEIGVFYHKTDEGRRAPLRRVKMHRPRPVDLRFIDNVRYSPTFILIENGAEIGRIVGYPGEDHFWGLLDGLIQGLPPQPRATLKRSGT